MASRPGAELHASREAAMSSVVEEAFLREWAAAAALRLAGDLDGAFAHLERAHIIGQRRTLLHLRSHCGMLAIGWQGRDRREVVGQLGRIIAALLFPRLWVPAGNTGGANVSPFAPMPLPDDLRAILDGDGR